MNIFFKISWLSLAFLFVFEVCMVSIFKLKISGDILVLYACVILPVVQAAIRDIKKDFILPRISKDIVSFGMLFLIALVGVWCLSQGYYLGNVIAGVYLAFSVIFVCDSRIAFVVAGALFGACPVLMLVHDPETMLNLSVLGFYFLFAGVCTQLREFPQPVKPL